MNGEPRSEGARRAARRPLLRLGVLSAVVLLVLCGAACSTAERPADPSEPRLRVVAGDGQAGFVDGAPGRFHKPIRLAPFGDGAILVADIFNHAIRRVTRDGQVLTLSGAPDRKGHRDGPAEVARFASPHGIAVSPEGLIAVAEAENHTIRLLRPRPAEAPAGAPRYEITTLAGVPGTAGWRDGEASQALFSSPHAVLWNDEGGLWVADIGNARVRLVEQGRVTTVAGSGEEGREDGAPEKATFHYPMDLALDRDGTLLVADAGSHLVRRLTLDRRVATLPLRATLETPHGITVDPRGTLWVAEIGAHRVVGFDLDGEPRTVCGTAVAGASPEQLDSPAAVLFHDGWIWIADLGNHRISALPLDDN